MENMTLSIVGGDFEWSYQRATILAFASIFVATYFFNAVTTFPYLVKAPVVGKKNAFEPEWLPRLRYPFRARNVLYEGYRKFKGGMFYIVRNDSNILVVNQKYLSEIGNLPDSHSSSSVGQIRNMAGEWCTADIITKSDLHFRMIQHKLTPNIASTYPLVKHELDHALSVEVPQCNDRWVEVPIFDLLSLLVARVTGRVFVGPELCRNPDWIKASIDYDINVGTTVVILRMLPPLFHPLVCRLLPSWWRAHSNIRAAQKIVGSAVRARRYAEDHSLDYEKPEDLLQWMMEDAQGWEADPNSLALRQLVVNLAALHTTSMAMTHATYDLCAHPEYFQPLRQELLDVLRTDGGWQKQTVNKLRKLDSFIKETQRWSPASLMSFNRYLRQPFKLADGTQLPAGTHLCLPAEPIYMDDEFVPGGNAQQFDGFRFEREPDDSEHQNRFQLSTVDSSQLHFGAGRYACPGRFFAAAVMKIMFAHMLLRYDFKYKSDQEGRPENMFADENIFPNPSVKILMRERPIKGSDVEHILSIGAELEQWDAA